MTDHAGNFLKATQMAAKVVQLIDLSMLKVLYNVYYMQINEGNPCWNIRQYGDTLGHVHIADVPGCHESGTGEINCVKVLKYLDETGYTGVVGCKLFPGTDSKKGAKGHHGCEGRYWKLLRRMTY